MTDKPRRKSQSSFTATEVGVLIEDFQGQLSLIAEGQTSIQKKVDLIWEAQGRTMERVTMVELRLTSIEGTLKGHGTRLSRVEDAVLK